MMSGIGLAFIIILLVLVLFCDFKESSITSPYKIFKTFGWLRAFLRFNLSNNIYNVYRIGAERVLVMGVIPGTIWARTKIFY